MNKVVLPQFKGNDLLLHAVSHIDGKQIITLLEDKEADVNCRNINGETPLHYAVIINNAKIAELLLKFGADPDLRDYNESGEKAPIHYAVEKNCFECVKVLLENGANSSIQDKRGQTPLHYAARFGFIEIVNLLLAHGCDVHIRDKNGFNASYWAEANKQTQILSILPPPKSIPPEDYTEFKLKLREIHKITVKLGKKKKGKKKK